MPQIVNCPECSRKLRIPDTMLGKAVQCPSCCVKFKATVGGSSPPEEVEELEELEEAPEEGPRSRGSRAGGRDERIGTRPQRSSRRDDDEDDRPRSRRRRDDDDEDYPRSRRGRYDDEDEYEDNPRRERRSWDKMVQGIQLVAIGTWVWIGGTLVGGILLLLGVVAGYSAFTSSSFDSFYGSAGVAGVCFLIAIVIKGLCSLAELILRAIGYGLCMAVPNKRGNAFKALAITAFALVGAEALLSLSQTAYNTHLGAGMLGAFGGGVASVGYFGHVIALVTLASFIVWLIFLRGVCTYVRQRRLGGQMITVMIVFISFYLISGFLLVILIAIALGSLFSRLGMGGFAFNPIAFLNFSTGWGIIFSLAICTYVLGHLGLHVWYISLLQQVRGAIASHRRQLLD